MIILSEKILRKFIKESLAFSKLIDYKLISYMNYPIQDEYSYGIVNIITNIFDENIAFYKSTGFGEPGAIHLNQNNKYLPFTGLSHVKGRDPSEVHTIKFGAGHKDIITWDDAVSGKTRTGKYLIKHSAMGNFQQKISNLENEIFKEKFSSPYEFLSLKYKGFDRNRNSTIERINKNLIKAGIQEIPASNEDAFLGEIYLSNCAVNLHIRLNNAFNEKYAYTKNANYFGYLTLPKMGHIIRAAEM